MEGVIDTHCHLDFEDYKDELPEVLARARAAGVVQMICIGSGRDISSASSSVALAESEPDIFATVGIHPHDAARIGESDWLTLETLANHPRVVGVGETGLDYYYEHSPPEPQKQAFRRFIALARQSRRPVVSHVRDAHEDAQQILREEGAAATGGIIHCFTGGVAEARVYLEMGQYLSFSGIATFKTAEPIREAVRFAPWDRILVETDAPYLAPVPYRGKRNEPAFVIETLKLVAGLKGTDIDEAARLTSENARRAFGLPAPPAKGV